MIHILLNVLAERMNDFLSSYYDRAEVMVEAGVIDASPDEDQTDKILLSITNIERETAMGINSRFGRGPDVSAQRNAPPWHLNIYVIVAAVFSQKRYMESLQILSDTLSFLQQNSSLSLPGGSNVTIEPVSTSTQELSNIWSILGGHYHPSVLCKIRMITFDGSEIKEIKTRIKERHIN